MEGKTVIRGAFDVSSYLEGTGTNLRLTQNPPFTPPQVEASNVATVRFTAQTAFSNAALADQVFFLPGPQCWLGSETVEPVVSYQWELFSSVEHIASKHPRFKMGY